MRKLYLHSPNMYFWRAQGLDLLTTLYDCFSNGVANKNYTLRG